MCPKHQLTVSYHQWAHQYDANTGEPLKLVESIETNTKHYVELFSRAIDKQMPAPSTEIS
jgi:DNA replication licensing factor MCM7